MCENLILGKRSGVNATLKTKPASKTEVWPSTACVRFFTSKEQESDFIESLKCLISLKMIAIFRLKESMSLEARERMELVQTN